MSCVGPDPVWSQKNLQLDFWFTTQKNLPHNISKTVLPPVSTDTFPSGEWSQPYAEWKAFSSRTSGIVHVSPVTCTALDLSKVRSNPSGLWNSNWRNTSDKRFNSFLPRHVRSTVHVVGTDSELLLDPKLESSNLGVLTPLLSKKTHIVWNHCSWLHDFWKKISWSWSQKDPCVRHHHKGRKIYTVYRFASHVVPGHIKYQIPPDPVIFLKALTWLYIYLYLSIHVCLLINLSLSSNTQHGVKEQKKPHDWDFWMASCKQRPFFLDEQSIFFTNPHHKTRFFFILFSQHRFQSTHV